MLAVGCCLMMTCWFQLCFTAESNMSLLANGHAWLMAVHRHSHQRQTAWHAWHNRQRVPGRSVCVLPSAKHGRCIARADLQSCSFDGAQDQQPQCSKTPHKLCRHALVYMDESHFIGQDEWPAQQLWRNGYVSGCICNTRDPLVNNAASIVLGFARQTDKAYHVRRGCCPAAGLGPGL